mgnify:CR=1 FL=1
MSVTITWLPKTDILMRTHTVKTVTLVMIIWSPEAYSLMRTYMVKTVISVTIVCSLEIDDKNSNSHVSHNHLAA